MSLKDPPLPTPTADDRVLRDVLRRIAERDIETEPGIVDVDALLPVKLSKRPGRNLRWPKK